MNCFIDENNLLIVDALLRVRAYVAPRFTQPNVQEIVREG